VLEIFMTSFAGEIETFSEPEATSDNFSSSTRYLVRTWVYFGQLFRFHTISCPNLRLLRTTFPLPHDILSELGSTSDNFSSSTRYLVRTWVYFGQLFLSHMRSCPNLGLLRTTFPLQHGILSEPGSTSDNFSSST